MAATAALGEEGSAVRTSGDSGVAALAVCVSAIGCAGEVVTDSEVATVLSGAGDCAVKSPAQQTNAALNQKVRAADIVLEAGQTILYRTPLHLCGS